MKVQTTHSRNRDFIRKCYGKLEELRGDGKTPSVDEVVDAVLAEAAPCYYVDYYQACHVMVQAVRSGRVPTNVYKCAEQWEDMYRDLLDVMRRYPLRSFRGIVMSLCVGEEGRPRFYITHDRAVRILRPHLSTQFVINLNPKRA